MVHIPEGSILVRVSEQDMLDALPVARDRREDRGWPSVNGWVTRLDIYDALLLEIGFVESEAYKIFKRDVRDLLDRLAVHGMIDVTVDSLGTVWYRLPQ